MIIVFLYLLGPLIVLLYKVLEHFQVFDKITGRDKAISGIKRLKSATGFPQSWIYENKNEDKEIFNALYSRILKKLGNNYFSEIENNGFKPEIITIAGNPFPIEGVPKEWKQEEKFSYTHNHPILLTFKNNEHDEQKAIRVCSLGELEGWISSEKKHWNFIVGICVLFVFTSASVIFRLHMLCKI